MNFFNKEDLKKATINFKELDGMVVKLNFVETEELEMLYATDMEGKIYVLRTQIRFK